MKYDPGHVSLTAQIEEVEYEIKMRGQVYPRLITNGKLRQAIADEHLRRIKAVLMTLEALRDKPTKEEAILR